MKPDPARIAAGWEPRFTARGERAREMVRLYQELGFEVVTDPVDARDRDEGCADCALPAQLRFVTIYTRRRG